MKVLALICLALAIPAFSAGGTIPRAIPHTGVSAWSATYPQHLQTLRAVPDQAHAIVFASFNGHPSQACWADTNQQLECAWHGVLVVIQAYKKARPAIVSIASVRRDPVHVYVRISW